MKAIYLSGSSSSLCCSVSANTNLGLLPDAFASAYQGSGGSSHTAGVKIQLEYDLLSGQFMHVHSGSGKQNDRTYGSACLQTVQIGDLCIRDLGNFDLKDLHQMDKNGAYYISRLKLNNRIYLRNPEPEYFKTEQSKSKLNIFNWI